MTPEGFIALAAACDLSGFPADISIEARLSHDHRVQLTAMMRVKERDNGESIPLYTVSLVDLDLLAVLGVDGARREIRNCLARCVQHELDENIRWGRERPFDPHIGEKKR